MQTGVSAELDLVFACDCTGSMASYIESAKQNIKHIIERIQASEKADVRFALVSYRDHTDDYTAKKFDFTTSVKTAKQYVDTMAAAGGGDTPEAVADAMFDVLEMPYRKSATKICVIIADAPPHGLGFGSDNFAEGSKNGHDPVTIAHKLADRGVIVYCIGVEPVLSQSIFAPDFFKAVSKITGGRYLALGNAKILPDVIVGGATEEIKLEKLRDEIEKESEKVRSEAKTKGEAEPAAEAMMAQVTSNLQARGVQTDALKVDDIGGGEAETAASKMITGCKNLKQARDGLRKMPPEPRQGHMQRGMHPGAPLLPSSITSARAPPSGGPVLPSSASSASAPSPAYAPSAPYASNPSYASQSSAVVNESISYEQVARVMARKKN